MRRAIFLAEQWQKLCKDFSKLVWVHWLDRELKGNYCGVLWRFDHGQIFHLSNSDIATGLDGFKVKFFAGDSKERVGATRLKTKEWL